MARHRVALSILAGVLLASGCGDRSLFSASIWDPFGLRWRLGPHNEPLRIGLCYEYQGVFDIRNWGKTPPWEELRRDLEEQFQRPVDMENLEPFQIAFHLGEGGGLDFALVGAADYLEMTQQGPVGKVLAISKARQRQGVIVASAKSDLTELANLRGKQFAFGPKGDPVLHHATLAYLESNGVPASELRGLIPGQLQHHLSSREAAKEVAYLVGTSAGVIEAEEFDAYPETGGRWFPPPATFSKDLFRVLGRTEPYKVETMPEGPFLASEHVDAQLAEQMRKLLINLHDEHSAAVYALGFSRFTEVTGDPAAEIKRLAASP